ncbi:NADH:flavin oxidoreductase/NADH oxidase [Natronorubrum sp. FCH18a]|uniref:NADH:flavin oxidoreductase/NADH oxidase n=1 Tax=Natronorubrum sp. FCH18a TaxID=3447018 RepID=UPI003F510A23
MHSPLFDQYDIRGVTVPNRIMVSPMCQYSCEAEDGIATEWHHVHLTSRAVGGAGIVMTEATAVAPDGRISPQDLGIWSDDHGDALERTASFIDEMGSVPAIQLGHAGRKASKSRPADGNDPVSPTDGGWTAIGPGSEPWPYADGAVEYRQMDRDDIQRFREQFEAATRRALEAGFRIIEIHAAHGYLLHEFLSPVTNDRDDEYGGSFENRTRLLREITADVRDVVPTEYPVFVRLSVSDWLDDRPSWDVEQSIRLASELQEAGVDLVDVSSGGIHPDQQVPAAGPNYQVPYAERVRTEAGVPTAAVGKIRTAEQADAVIRNGRSDLVAIGRKYLHDPYFALHAAERLGVDGIEWPRQYLRAVEK